MDMKMLIAIAIAAASIFGGRYLAREALKDLDEKDKTALQDSFSGLRLFSLIPPVIIAVLYFVLLKFYQEYMQFLLAGFIVLMLVFIIGFNLFCYHKLKKLDIDKRYIRSFIITRMISTCGIIVFFIIYIAV